jgi:lipopolysaccharide transport system ATP-binding protein
MSTVIEVDDLWKKYRLGIIGTGTLRHDFERWWHRVRGKPDPHSKLDQRSEFRNRKSELVTNVDHRISGVSASLGDDEVWALRGVSFEVKHGEILGIIGRNGAGKSTLLKILSRVTAPTSGEVRVKGRIASLLEVGTGFHPELTGRENIFLNGAILGMTKAEISKKLDEIVDFAGVERYMDTPVKRYSSGMYVRLAFAVAAHLEPEILIVDEVLAVGDAEFQKKCLGKMQDVSRRDGRTVLFVSHNMNAVESLCQRIAHLDQGQLLTITDDVRKAVASYFPASVSTHGSVWCNPGSEFCNPWFQPLKFYLGDEQGAPAVMPIRNDQAIYVWIDGEVEQEDVALTVGYALYDDSGTLLYWSAHTDAAENLWPRVTKGRNVLRSQIPPRVLNQGKYRLELIAALYCRQWMSEPGSKAPAIELSIQGGLSDSPYWMEKRPGVLAPVCTWILERNGKAC